MQDDFQASFYSGEEAPVRRIQRPHLGWAALMAVLYFLAQIVLTVAALWKFGRASLDPKAHDPHHAMVMLLVNMLGAVFTIVFGWPIMRVFWGRPFWNVLEWHWAHARVRIPRLMLLGLAMCIVVATIERFLTMPKDIPMDQMFRSTGLLWGMTFYGTIIAPIFEETMFRGFLLPAFAVAIDWGFLKRERPSFEGNLSTASLIVSSLVTSAGFGLMHAQQLGFAWNAVALLSSVGLILAFVRIHYRSVACSAVVHATYNGIMFFAMFLATGGFRHIERLNK